MPMLAVTKCSPAASTIGWLIACATRSATRIASCAPSSCSQTTRNSSPPSRATVSDGPHGVVQPRRERDEQLVAGRVAHRVVDELELVEVGEQHGDRAAVAPPARERALEPVERQRAVRQRR